MEKMALKRLTKSDLTLFKDFYYNQGEHPSKQKAINLNEDVFVQRFYPVLKEWHYGDKIPVTLQILGPGLCGEYTLQRKILRSPGGKNWRLNGELVYDPENQQERFSHLEPEDIAILGFDGEPLPSLIVMDIISARNHEDSEIFKALDSFLNASMQVISSQELKDILPEVIMSHPIHRFLFDEDLDAAIEGDSEAALRVYRRGSFSMSKEELEAARKRASDTGFKGEAFTASYLQERVEKGDFIEYEWTAMKNAVAPYDFVLRKKNKTEIYLDVKSTKGRFDAPIHISMAELLTMGEKQEYRIFRVYEMDESTQTAKLRISEPVMNYAKQLLDIFSQSLPLDARPDGFTIKTEKLKFEEEILLKIEENNG